MISTLAIVALASTLVRAADPDCTTQFAGVLAANVAGTPKAFTLSSVGQIAYLGDGKSPLVVQFQECKSLELANPPGDTQLNGRLFVPQQGKCVAITNQANAAPPYFTTLQTCGTDSPQRFLHAADGTILWVGKTDEEGTDPQGGCGVLGYKAAVNGTPIITHTNNQITLECTSQKPFVLSLAVH